MTRGSPLPDVKICGIESARLKGEQCAITGISAHDARAYGIFQMSEWGGNNYTLRACLYKQIPHTKGHECYGPQTDFPPLLSSCQVTYSIQVIEEQNWAFSGSLILFI